jgi:hypothetical protein
LLAQFPEGYRHLAYLQTRIGYTVKRDMPGLKGAEVERLYAAVRRGSKASRSSGRSLELPRQILNVSCTSGGNSASTVSRRRQTPCSSA